MRRIDKIKKRLANAKKNLAPVYGRENKVEDKTLRKCSKAFDTPVPIMIHIKRGAL